jgi:SH3-like domain-containing protein
VIGRKRWLILILPVVFYCSAAFADRLSVSSSVANIRSGPDTKGYDILWKAERYYPMEVIEKKGGWYHFKDFEGDKGWIHKSLVSDTPSVITNRDKCNVRSSPSAEADVDILFTIEKGVPFRVLEKQGSWIKVQHADGDKGWIYKSLVW